MAGDFDKSLKIDFHLALGYMNCRAERGSGRALNLGIEICVEGLLYDATSSQVKKWSFMPLRPPLIC